jgi:hypothetical protein
MRKEAARKVPGKKLGAFMQTSTGSVRRIKRQPEGGLCIFDLDGD